MFLQSDVYTNLNLPLKQKHIETPTNKKQKTEETQRKTDK